jgi:hypothetical protein
MYGRRGPDDFQNAKCRRAEEQIKVGQSLLMMSVPGGHPVKDFLDNAFGHGFGSIYRRHLSLPTAAFAASV